MAHVRGKMKLEPDNNPYSSRRIDVLQQETCVDWIQKRYPERCQRFDAEKWQAIASELQTKPMSFCIDRYEYPNRRGQYPLIYVNFHEAKQMCTQQGKRLCNEDEWTFACEGESAKPYPYGTGYVRDPKKCITDEKWMPYKERAMVPRDGDNARHEMDRLWKGRASGGQTACRSDFGVYDMTGNIDEWTTSVRPGERPSILKGGYWGPVRTRCRPTTRSHDENHIFYQQGFRCCAEAGSQTTTPIAPAAPAPGPLDGPLQ
jgi:formylglycine-generating enzyme required for sulfatase activity